MNITHEDVVAQVDHGLLETISNLPDGWASATQLAWDIAGTDPDGRSKVYRALKKLASAGVWELVSARHQDSWMHCYEVRTSAIRDLLAEGR